MEWWIYYFVGALGAYLLLRNKEFLYLDDPRAWKYGIVGILLISPYMAVHEFWVSLVYNFSSVVLMIYGLIALKERRWLSKRTNKRVKIFLICASICTCFYFLVETGRQNFSLVQFFQASFGLIGTLFLVFDKAKVRMMGWRLYVVSHIFCIIYVMPNDGVTIGVCQAFSIIYAIIGIEKEKRKHSEEQGLTPI